MKVLDELVNDKTYYNESDYIIDYLYQQMKLIRNQMNELENTKPFWFQKKRMQEYLEEKKELEELIDTHRSLLIREMKFKCEFIENIKQQG